MATTGGRGCHHACPPCGLCMPAGWSRAVGAWAARVVRANQVKTKMTITLRTACTQQYMGHTGAVSKWSRGWQGSMAGFDMSVRTMVETILMVRGDQWTRPGVNQEPAAEAGGGCLRLAPLPPRQMLCKAARGRSACRWSLGALDGQGLGGRTVRELKLGLVRSFWVLLGGVRDRPRGSPSPPRLLARSGTRRGAWALAGRLAAGETCVHQLTLPTLPPYPP